MKRKIILSLILIAILLSVTGGIAYQLVNMKQEPPQTDRPEHALLVETIEVQPRTIQESIAGFGTARADLLARLAAEVPGRIVDMPDRLKPGVEVEQGQVLVRIDPDDFQQRFAQAQSALEAVAAQRERLETEDTNLEQLIAIARDELEIVEREYDRVKSLFDQDLAPKREHDLALIALKAKRRTLLELTNRKEQITPQRNELDALQRSRAADLELARLNLDRCTVVAPFSGRIEQVMVERGERVGVGTLLMSVLDPRLIEVAVELPISTRPRVKVGSACTLIVASMPQSHWSGKVKRIAPSATSATRTYSAYVEVDNSLHGVELVPGYFVEARVQGPIYENVMTVPRNVIQRGRVFVCEDRRAIPRDVQVERHLRDVSVVTGLEPGTRVITSNLDMLRQGLLVQPESETAVEEGTPLKEGDTPRDPEHVSADGAP